MGKVTAKESSLKNWFTYIPRINMIFARPPDFYAEILWSISTKNMATLSVTAKTPKLEDGVFSYESFAVNQAGSQAFTVDLDHMGIYTIEDGVRVGSL